jgi:hypothetical protein
VKNTERTLWAAVCLIVILVAGCAALSPQSTKQETIEERVKNFMQAQIDRKWDQAYSFFDASSRKETSRESYLSRPRKLSFKRYEIKEITVLPPGDRATVKVTYDIFMMGFEFQGAAQTQNWVKENGGWFVIWSEPTAQKNPFSSEKKQK